MAWRWAAISSAVGMALAAGPAFTSTLVQLDRCTPSSTTAACLAYERCKATHRCGRAVEEYTIATATLQSFGQQFSEGNRTAIPLMNDFEDWKTGMLGWRIAPSTSSGRDVGFAPPTPFGLSSFAWPVLGSLELAHGTLLIDTTTARISGDVTLQGVVTQTAANTTVAVFNFLTLYLGDQVRVQLKGANALALLSRSSAVIDTPLVAPSSVRAYVHTISTTATVAPTIQQVTTRAAPGQTIRGSFVLQLRHVNSSEIPFDASALDVKRIIEDSFASVHVGVVEVHKIGQDVASVGRTWRITFLTAAGQVPLLASFSRLTGLDSTVETSLLSPGNQLDGFFRLGFLGQLSPPIAYNIKPRAFESLLLQAFNLTTAYVQRSDPLDQCAQGGIVGQPSPSEPAWLLPDSASPSPPLCGSAPSTVRGYIWNVQVTTTRGNVSPTSPTTFLTPTPLDAFVAVTANSEGPTLLGAGASVIISSALGFSMAYGGAGGAYGGVGGAGYSSPRPPLTYGDAAISDLIGGSGGAGGGQVAIDILPHPRPILGGAGGGAMYIGAVNDVTIGPSGLLTVNGAPGEAGFFPGGGGSGGGAGGSSSQYPLGGGAGGGGRISIQAHAYAVAPTGAMLSQGTLHLDLQTQLQLSHDPFRGAAQTAKSLYLAKYTLDPNPRMEGPAYAFPPSRPARISYFTMVGATQEGTLATNRGAVFGAIGDADATTFVWAIGLVNGRFTYGAGLSKHAQPLRELYTEPVVPFRWYQVDVFMDWTRYTLSIRLNGVTVATNVAFATDTLATVGIYLVDAMQTWWDEIYVGSDETLQFACPRMHPVTGRLSVAPRPRPLWNPAVLGPTTAFSAKVRHASHVSARAIYRYNDGGLVPNDGPAHRSYLNDIRDARTYDGSDDTLIGLGELLHVALPMDPSIVPPLTPSPDAPPQATLRTPDETAYWYSEVYHGSSGGIGACSTHDGGRTWRNEGVMLHFANLSDPFGNTLQRSLRGWFLTRTANLSCGCTSTTLQISGVAVAAYPNGPFQFLRSFYPMAATEAPGGQPINETHDHTVFCTSNTEAYLVQSYFKTVEYWLPRPIMDPLWESVKHADGSTYFALNYHRAFFSDAYDNVDDIYLQRFRSEDIDWSISCCNRTTHVCSTSVVIANRYCPPQYRKQVNGQGQGGRSIQSRYKDPNDPENNAFRAHSVPSHTDWGFSVYNIKTWRGTYFDALSTNITRLLFETFAGMSSAYATPPSLQVTYPLPGESAPYINVTDPPNVLELILETMGVPLPRSFVAKFDDFDIKYIDGNGDGKITLDELATLVPHANKGIKVLSTATYNLFQTEFAALKRAQLQALNPNGDDKVTYAEFAAWIGNDPGLMFDRFDLDKSGYLDENELSRFFIDRQLPRLDLISILLDPDFDGRVYYDMFESFVLNATTVLFVQYDFDRSNSLDSGEIALLEADLGVTFLDTSVLARLVDPTSQLLTFSAYQQWMSASTSLVHDRVQQYKIDNAIVSTRPDRMTGPLHVVEQRRAKYLSISRLAPDFLSTEALVVEMEGDFDGEGSLVDFARFNIPFADLSALATPPRTVPFRQFLAPADFGHVASYWNGYQWELRPSAPARFTYGTECATLTPTNNADCLPCASQSPYMSPLVLQYQSLVPTLDQCRNDKALDAYIKQFDQQVSITLRFQQVAQLTSAGVQPHYTPCFNQSESVPCDVFQAYEGGVGDASQATPWNVAWDRSPRNVGTSTKLRASPMQSTSFGQTFAERYPDRSRAPPSTLDINSTNVPDQYGNVLGGG
ncbi:hypothetical protein SPRG_20541 [Saprolegnia parasitica CBS 223.65]|uniref:EF-hand domain-containing protein n=1 Tax=Saprolegnia parasitica (strain CBS 223.65) TaxID=695850 RepID=A0A067C8D6_SAPPC|nr:hypothetical protein SPRG_20541 [Saprolegnia parasitica CBS 223.65]KDO26743.1 hypothetical protein SPRG_20541 [Saprolegnia parasitica CBS 223.65]|eukprot:XP_012202623.1 hypothetical protein SPRG_20541 [Saprolegnia parasitica CBS 223.65]